jgi:hypothetical protein
MIRPQRYLEVKVLWRVGRPRKRARCMLRTAGYLWLQAT